MKKIMFNDRYGLTQAVLEGRKTMTRRIAPYPPFDEFLYINTTALLEQSRYNVGEIVAVAQSYNDIYKELKRTHGSSSYITRNFFHEYIQGGRMLVSNKMFVRADLMPHKIHITDVDVERLQEISDDDCMKEGIFYDYGEDVDGSEISYFDFVGNNGNGFDTPREAFAALIDKVSGKGTWNSNPWVFVYSFELIK